MPRDLVDGVRDDRHGVEVACQFLQAGRNVDHGAAGGKGDVVVEPDLADDDGAAMQADAVVQVLLGFLAEQDFDIVQPVLQRGEGEQRILAGICRAFVQPEQRQ